MSDAQQVDTGPQTLGAPIGLPGDPPFESLLELLEHRARHSPHRNAATLLQRGKPPFALDYHQLYQSAKVIAHQLDQAGVARGDHVLIILPTSAEFLATYFGILMVGAATVPAAPPYSVQSMQLEAYAETLHALLKDARPKVCVTLPRLAGLLETLIREQRTEVTVLSASLQGPMLEPARFRRPKREDTALLQYTSGSTSEPKGVVLTHQNLLANTGAIVQALHRHEGDITLSWLPLYHDMGLIGTFLTPIRGNVPVVLIPPQDFIKDPACWLKAASEHQASISVAPNFAFGYCAARVSLADLPGVRLDTLRALLNGAEPIDIKLMEHFEEAFAPLGLKKNVVRPVYGLAESSLAVSFHPGGPIASIRLDADRLEQERRAVPVEAGPGVRAAMFVSVGRPIATQELRIVDEQNLPVKEGEIGEVTVKGPSVTSGYYQRPADTAQAIRGGWLFTGDYGFLINGNVFITGRKKDLIIRRGRNYYPQDIEFQVSKVPGVRKGSVVAFAIEVAGADTELVVIAETKLKERAELEALAPKIRERVSHAFAIAPKDVRLVAPGVLPKTTSGKPRRSECKRRYLEGTLEVKAKLNVRALVGLGFHAGLAYLKRWLKNQVN